MKRNAMVDVMVKKAAREVIKNPDKALPRGLKLVESLDRKKVNARTYEALHTVLDDPDNNWNIFLHNIFSNVAPESLEKLSVSLVLNAAMESYNKRMENVKKYDCNIPWAILMDPTAACNLKCTGCWAAEYGKNASLPYDVMEKVIREGTELGVYTYIFSGGEPLVRKEELIQLCDSHPECIFLAFTNGTLVDEAFAKELRRVGNFGLAFSIEGFEEETDMRRGAGTYQAVIRAMDLLKAEGVAFGFSTCYHSKNVDCVGSDAYVDFMIEKGCLFGWYFTYIPVGVDAVPELIATAEQREFMYHQMRKWRQTKPAFLLDFWNDGEYTLGCVAGGRNYFHINAAGECEPCAFIHYANVNIKDCSLLEALQSPLFMEYHRGQPFNQNHLRPCPLLDNPHCLREMVERSGAHSTEMLSPEPVEQLTSKTQAASEAWGPVADRIWEDPNEPKYASRSRLYHQKADGSPMEDSPEDTAAAPEDTDISAN